MVEARNPLTTLLKKKYGISRQSSLSIKDDDSLFTAFRKVAAYIYRNSDWQEQDYAKAIKDYLELSGMEGQVTGVKRTAVGGDAIGGLNGTKDIFEFNSQDEKGNKQHQFFAIDNDNKSWTQQGQRWRHRENDGIFWYTGNANYTIGYSKLLSDIYNDWLRAPIEYHQEISPSDFKHFMERFVKHRYANKSFGLAFTPKLIGSLTHEEFMQATKPEDPKKGPHNARVLKQEFLATHPDFKKRYGIPGNIYYFYDRSQQSTHREYILLNFVNRYLQSTYNIIRQQRYEHDLSTKTHAKAWEEKKNINKATQQIMDKTVLNKYFDCIELDNDIDLRQFKRFEEEAMRLVERLPKSNNPATLRLRKLGNYHDAGMYVPLLNTIVVDFRKPSEIYADVVATKKEEASFTSFIHEYGHYLDYNIGNDKLPLSLQPKFLNIQQTYAKHLKNLGIKGKYFGYLSTPTEVFARSFEIYTHDYCGLRGNLNSSNYSTPDYLAFSDDLKQEVANYFDSMSEFKPLRKLLNIDTSIDPNKERQFEDDRQNDKSLNDYSKLVDFSKEMLQKWTHNPDDLEKLIDTTAKHLNISNPTRVIAFDKWQNKMPDLISRNELRENEIMIQKYPHVSYIQGFSKVGKHWTSDRLYSVKDLKNDMWEKPTDYKKLTKIIKSKEKDRGQYEIISRLANKAINREVPKTTMDKLQHRIAKYVLTEARSAAHIERPFKFSTEERTLLENTTSQDKQNLFTSAVRLAWKAEPQIDKGLRRTREHNINHSLVKQMSLGIDIAANRKER